MNDEAVPLVEKNPPGHVNYFHPNKQKGITLSFVSLLLLGTLPIISNSRPQALNALNFSFYLSLWQLVCALPLLFVEFNQGILDKDLSKKLRNQTLYVMLITGIIFSFSP